MATMELGIPYVEDEWDPHGLSCMDCGTVLREGERYTERLAAFTEDHPVVETVCLDCGTARRPER